MYCLLFYVFFFFSVLFKYFKVHLDDSFHLHTNLRYYSNPHYLILPILIGAHLGASGHLLKEQLGLIWIHIVQDDFYWHLENARFHRQPMQLPREQREAERSSLRRHIAWETALWLWDARSQLLGLLAVSDIAQGAYEEWQTSSEGKSPELGGRRWVCYLWHLYRHTVGSPLFPPADKGIHFLYQPTDLLREVLFEKKKRPYHSRTLECIR